MGTDLGRVLKKLKLANVIVGTKVRLPVDRVYADFGYANYVLIS
jgi:hypothetical protein